MRISGLRIGASLIPTLLCSPLMAKSTRPAAAAPLKEQAELGVLSSPHSAMTNGESRILKPDLTKTFNPASARFGSTPSPAPTQSTKTSFFGGLKTFGASKPASQEKTFPSSAFQTPVNSSKKAEVRSFSSGSSFDSKFSPQKGYRASSDNFPDTNRAFGGMTSARESGAKPPAMSSEEYAGPEADKKKLRYNPGNGPLGGTTYGKVLSVEEVREILNRSK